MRRVLIAAAVLWLAAGGVAAAAPEGTLTIAMHFTPVTRWLDPAEGESTITPFFLLYALHDGLLKPMPGVGSGPSLAQSRSMSSDMLAADFTLRANAKLHPEFLVWLPNVTVKEFAVPARKEATVAKLKEPVA